MSWLWNPGQRSLQVNGTDAYRSATYDFLLTFHTNHGPISHRFRDRRIFQSKIAKFSHPVCFTPQLKGFPLELGIGARVKNWNDGATRWSQKFKIGLAVLSQYRRVTDRRTRVVRGSIFIDPAQPNPPNNWPNPTQPTARWTYGPMTQPNPYPIESPYIEQQLTIKVSSSSS